MPRDAETAKFRLLSGLPLSTGQAAVLAGVGPKTVSSWIRHGKVRASRSPGGHYLIPANEVRAILGGRSQAA